MLAGSKSALRPLMWANLRVSWNAKYWHVTSHRVHCRMLEIANSMWAGDQKQRSHWSGLTCALICSSSGHVLECFKPCCHNSKHCCIPCTPSPIRHRHLPLSTLGILILLNGSALQCVAPNHTSYIRYIRCIIAKHLSASQLILLCISMYVCMSVTLRRQLILLRVPFASVYVCMHVRYV